MKITTRKRGRPVVLIRGAGEVASAIARRLHRAGFRVCMTETAKPLAVCRTTCFSEAVFDGRMTIEGVTAELAAPDLKAIRAVWKKGRPAVVVDPETSVGGLLKPDILIDATMAKRSTGVTMRDAPLVMGVGPGFCAGRDVHIVIETHNGPDAGKAIFQGEAERDTGEPVAVGGFTRERVVWAPAEGIFQGSREICDRVAAGDTLGSIGDIPIKAPMSGVLRGLIRSGVKVTKGCKMAEVDPISHPDLCYFIRDKMRVIAEGVVMAIQTAHFAHLLAPPRSWP